MYPFYNQNQQPQVSYMSSHGRDMVINYPIAPGNTIIFRDEAEPYVYIKTMGYSPMDKPVLEIYRREDAQDSKQSDVALDKIQEDIKGIIEEIDNINKKLNYKPRRKDGDNDSQ